MIRPLLRVLGRVSLLAAAFALLAAVYLFQFGAFFMLGAGQAKERRARVALDLVTGAVQLLATIGRQADNPSGVQSPED